MSKPLRPARPGQCQWWSLVGHVTQRGFFTWIQRTQMVIFYGNMLVTYSIHGANNAQMLVIYAQMIIFIDIIYIICSMYGIFTYKTG